VNVGLDEHPMSSSSNNNDQNHADDKRSKSCQTTEASVTDDELSGDYFSPDDMTIAEVDVPRGGATRNESNCSVD
jgi:hypothetical protein